MNDKLLDALFARRKEAVTRLAFCLLISSLLAVASRIPILFVSLPATWITGGLSIAFIWVIGPPILIVLQAYALHGVAEAEQLRTLLKTQSSAGAVVGTTAATQLGEELTPIGVETIRRSSTSLLRCFFSHQRLPGWFFSLRT